MKRHASQDLEKWLKAKKRKPIVLRGARQVGKSTLIRNFAQENNLTLFEINLEKIKLHTTQTDGIDLQKLIQEIEFIKEERISNKTLLFFDEIQEDPKLLMALRYFYEERPDIPVIAAGSLLEFALNAKDFSMPVGRIEYFYLGPMSFTEFLLAMGKTLLLDALTQLPQPVPEIAHTQLLNLFREYLFVGGMPEAVATYIESKNALEVRRVHHSILSTYQDDFGKYSTKAHMGRLRQIFNFVPGHLGQKIKYSTIDAHEKSRDLKHAIELLIQARILIPCYHTNATALPLAALKDESVYKLYFLDVGLVNTLQNASWEQLVLQKINSEVIKGAIAEQFTAQHLYYLNSTQMPPELFYWLRDKKNQNAEVDFIINIGEEIIPVEVKASSNEHIKSMVIFAALKKIKWGIKISQVELQTKNIDQKSSIDSSKFKLINVPFYAIERLAQLLSI